MLSWLVIEFQFLKKENIFSISSSFFTQVNMADIQETATIQVFLVYIQPYLISKWPLQIISSKMVD